MGFISKLSQNENYISLLPLIVLTGLDFNYIGVKFYCSAEFGVIWFINDSSSVLISTGVLGNWLVWGWLDSLLLLLRFCGKLYWNENSALLISLQDPKSSTNKFSVASDY